MPEKTEAWYEAWLDEKNRIVSFHEIPDSQYYSTDDHTFWQRIYRMILTGYRVQERAKYKESSSQAPACGLLFVS